MIKDLEAEELKARVFYEMGSMIILEAKGWKVEVLRLDNILGCYLLLIVMHTLDTSSLIEK